MFRLLLVDATNRVNVMSRTAKIDDPVKAFLAEVARTSTLCGGATPILCWDHPEASSYKRSLYPQYKMQRPDDKVAQEADNFVRQCVIEGRKKYCTWWDAEYEADDLIATAVKHAPNIPLVIHSQDGDMSALLAEGTRLQITSSTGLQSRIAWVNYRMIEEKLGIRITQFEEYRALIGDSSDNLPGVKDIGKKTAVSILRQFDTIAEAVAAGELLDIPPFRREALRRAFDDGSFELAMQLTRLRTTAVVPPHVQAVIDAAALPLAGLVVPNAPAAKPF